MNNKKYKLSEHEILAFKEKLKEAINIRDEFLKAHPEMAEFQKRIDQALETVGDDPQKRMDLLAKMMNEHVKEKLIPEMKKLKDQVEKFNDTAKKILENERAIDQVPLSKHYH